MLQTFRFDWKSMGINAYIPLFVVLFISVYVSLLHGNIRYIIPAIELGLPVCSAWWAIFLFHDILDEPGSEVIFSYPTKRRKIGIFRVLLFCLLYSSIISILICVIVISTGNQTFLLSFLLQIYSECLFFSSLGFAAVALSRHISWSLYIVAGYASFQVITKGNVNALLNVFVFNERFLSLELLLSSIFKTILLSAILFIIGQKTFDHMERFN